MNAERRKELAEAVGWLADALDRVNRLADEEQEAFDNMPEGLQGSDRGQAMEEAAGSLQEAADEIECVIEKLGEIE